MQKIIDNIVGDYKIGQPLVFDKPKLVLEATETVTSEQAIRTYNMDGKAHRPHYVVDPRAKTIHKTANTDYSVIGDFHPTAPHRVSRCIFVAIVKSAAIHLNEKETVSVGKLLRVICDVEAIPIKTHNESPGDKIGITTLKNFEGILCWYSFPSEDQSNNPGRIDWVKLNEGLTAQDKQPEKKTPSGGSLKSKKIAELREMASELKISQTGLKKEELIKAIENIRSTE